GSLRPVLEALEEQVVILRLLSAAQSVGVGGPAGVTVQIGEETQAAEIRGASVVSSVYGSEAQMLGGMGVLGPTRMDYPGTIASVAAVAHYVGEILVGHVVGNSSDRGDCSRVVHPGTIASVAAVAHYVGEILVGR